MKTRVLSLGLLPLLIGLYLWFPASQSVEEIAWSLGAYTDTSETQTLYPNTLITVPTYNYSLLKLKQPEELKFTTLEGSYNASSEISFYIFNQNGFSNWNSGKPVNATDIFTIIISAKEYNFSEPLSSLDDLFIVFDNRSSEGDNSVLFALSATAFKREISFWILYLPQELVALGLILIYLGLRR